MRTKVILIIISLSLILAGIFTIIFPRITNDIYIKDSYMKKEEFLNTQNENNLEYEELYQMLKERNEQLYLSNQSELKDPFSYQENNIDLSEYGIKDNIIGYIEIPKINLTIPIFLGANKDNLRKGAVHLTQTSYPIGGENTNCVIGGHSGYSLAEMFNNIDDLELGDIVYIHNFRETLSYEVYEKEVINPTDIDRLKIQSKKDILTLITCYPIGANTHRYVVYCKRINK